MIKIFTKYLRCFLILFFAPYLIFCQKNVTINYGKFVDGVNNLSRSAVYIKTPKGSGSGTLFMVPYNDTSKGGIVYLTTALHVLDKTDSNGVKIGRFDTVSVYLNLKMGGKESRKYTLKNLSESQDIAILEPIEKFRHFSEYDVIATSLNNFVSDSELRKGQTAFIAGYPYRLGTESKNLNPVIQSGIVAYTDTTQNLVLIDIPVNYGDSGCPVYIVTESGMVKLLGIVFQYQPNFQDLVYNKAKKVWVPANSSLGKVVLLHSILVDLFKSTH